MARYSDSDDRGPSRHHGPIMPSRQPLSTKRRRLSLDSEQASSEAEVPRGRRHRKSHLEIERLSDMDVRTVGRTKQDMRGPRTPERIRKSTTTRGSIFDLGRRNGESSNFYSVSEQPDSPEWRKPKHELQDGSSELLLIHSAEHKTFKENKEKLVLLCSDWSKGVNDQDILPVKLRWL